MIGLKPVSSGIGNACSVNCATTAVLFVTKNIKNISTLLGRKACARLIVEQSISAKSKNIFGSMVTSILCIKRRSFLCYKDNASRFWKYSLPKWYWHF